MIPEVTDSSWGEVRREEARRTLLHLRTDCRGHKGRETERGIKLINWFKFNRVI